MNILDSIDSKRFNSQDPSCSENCLKIENSIQWQCRITPRYLQEIKFNGKFNFSRLLPPPFFITFTSFSILFLGIIAQWGQLFYEVDFDITKSVISKDIFWHNLLKFIYCEKATKFCEIFTLLLTGTTLVCQIDV